MADAFTIDDAYDRDRASDGVSRYGVYLGMHAEFFAADVFGGPQVAYTTDPVEYAAAAWQVASSPRMAPGYVTAYPLIDSAKVGRSMEDGSLQADVRVFAPGRPPELQDLLGWSGWGLESGRPVEPSPRDIAHAARMLTTVRLLFCVSPERLYVPASAPDRLTVADAKASVKRTAELLNTMLAPVLGQMEAGR